MNRDMIDSLMSSCSLDYVASVIVDMENQEEVRIQEAIQTNTVVTATNIPPSKKAA